MKNGNSIRAQALILKGISPMEVVKVDAERSERAVRAWDTRGRAEPKAEGEGKEPKEKAGPSHARLLHVDDAIKKIAESSKLIATAHESLDASMDAKTRTEAAGHLMEALRSYKAAADVAGHAGAEPMATAIRGLSSAVARQIDVLYDEKKINPDYSIIKDAKKLGADTVSKMGDLSRSFESNRVQGKGEGAVPGYKKMKAGDMSRATVFSGGAEMRAHQDDVRQQLRSVGFGRVAQAKEEALGGRNHELWEHPDGRSVLISLGKSDKSDMQLLRVKERAQDRWKATREEFVRIYKGSAALTAPGGKPGLAPKGLKIGEESELPFMPESAP